MTSPDGLAVLDRITLRQRITMMVNRYEVRAGGADGPMLALAEQKRFALKESVTFYSDEAKTQPVFGFLARNVMDLNATYDITDGAGQPIGLFRKDFGASLLRSTWIVEVPGQGITGRGQERNAAVAFLRRFTDFGWPIHFHFTTDAGDPLISIERQWSLRDSYDCSLPAASNGARLDWRVGACLAVACDALMGR